jgi:SAM-dependent methyltransferase
MDFSPFLWLRVPWNAGCFAFRQWLGWRRGLPELDGQPWRSARSFWPPEKADGLSRRAAELVHVFQMEPFEAFLNGRQWFKNLYLLDLLLQTLGPHLPSVGKSETLHPEPMQVLDIGSGDWEYVFALHRFFRNKNPTTVHLSGVEMDGHGIYPDGYSRADYTAAYIRSLQDKNVDIRYGDMTGMEFPRQDVVTCFFPFILPYQILAWGLPLHLLRPRQLLQRQAECIKPGGIWYLVCHAQEERDPMRMLLAEFQDFQMLAEGPARSDFEDDPSSYDERWYWVFRKQSEDGDSR